MKINSKPLFTKEPLFNDDVYDLNPKEFTKKKIKKLKHGKKYLGLLQEAVDKKFVKHKSVDKMLRHFVKKELPSGACEGATTEIMRNIKKHGADKKVVERASRTNALATQCIHNMYYDLADVVKNKKSGNKKKLKALKKANGTLNVDKVNSKKLEKFVKKTDAFIDKAAEHDKTIFKKGKKFSIKETDKMVKFIKKYLKKNKKATFHIELSAKKELAHAVTAGVRKNPYIFDENKGLAIIKNPEMLVANLKKHYFTRDSAIYKEYDKVLINVF